MREIKFRAWDKETGEMVWNSMDFEMRSLGYYEDGANHKACSEKCGDPCKAKDEFIGFPSDCAAWAMMQYTGLKDKNGKDSYHKDIIRSETGLTLSIEYGEYQSRSGTGFGWYLAYQNGEPYVPFPYDLSYYEVIGNICENPGLSGVEE